MRLAALLAAIAMALPAAAREKRPLSVERVRQEIAARGAKPALARLYDDEDAWTSLTSRISDGGLEWLKVAERFLAVAEDPAAYDLEASVGEALGRAPDHVLAVADERAEIAISWVCGETASFEEDPSYEERVDLLAERERAVAAVRDPVLAKKRDACLKELGKARQAVERELKAATQKIG
jgi:hypothetical protein